MAFGGFKAFIRDVAAISGGGTYLDQAPIIKDVARGIVDTGEGWALDTALNASYDDVFTYDGHGAALFLVHSGGAKLCVSMVASGGNNARLSGDYLFNFESDNVSYDGVACGGLSMALIPPGLGDFVPSTYGSTGFMPATALRLVGFGRSYSSSIFPRSFIETPGMDGLSIRYMIAVRGAAILAACRRLDYFSCDFFAIGDLIKPAHADDANTYASVVLSSSQTTHHEGGGDGVEFGLFAALGSDSVSLSFGNAGYGNAQLYAADGSLSSGKRRYGTGSAGGTSVAWPYNTEVVKAYDATSRRFVPFFAKMRTSDATGNYGTVPYDGYKGVINPEILAHIWNPSGSPSLRTSLGATMDGGKMLHLCAGVCIGWDPSNTARFWG